MTDTQHPLFRPGDRVVRTYDGKKGRVHAVYPNDLEDDTEVLFDDGVYTCSNHTHFLLIHESDETDT